jgi:PAS domain S-box-containing protein
MSALGTLADSIMAHLNLRLSHKHIRQHVNDLQLAASIFDSANEAMMVTGPDNHIITVNPAFTMTTGYEQNEVIGKNPNLLKSGKQGFEFYQKLWDILNKEGHWSGELWNKRKNGELYLEWLSVRALFNEDGSKRLHLAIFSDITKRKHAEELLQRHAILLQ